MFRSFACIHCCFATLVRPQIQSTHPRTSCFKEAGPTNALATCLTIHHLRPPTTNADIEFLGEHLRDGHDSLGGDGNLELTNETNAIPNTEFRTLRGETQN